MVTTQRAVLFATSLILLLLITSFAPLFQAEANERPAAVRIIGGIEAPPGPPGVVSIQDRSSAIYGGVAGHLCTGSLVAPRWVLTAAHCANVKSLKLDVIAKTRDLRFKRPTRRAVVARVIHPQYQPKKGNGYDVALLYLNRGIYLPGYLKISAEQVITGARVTAKGWGATRKSLPAKLRQLTMNSAADCLGQNAILLCASKPKTRATICSGDSGGPLFNNAGLLVGVSNFAGRDQYRCWHRDVRSGFARISYYYDWLLKKMSAKPTGFNQQRPARLFAKRRLPLMFSVYAFGAQRYQGATNELHAEIYSTKTIKWARIEASGPSGRFCTQMKYNIGIQGCWGHGWQRAASMVLADGGTSAVQWLTTAETCPRLVITLKVGRKVYKEPWSPCLPKL